VESGRAFLGVTAREKGWYLNFFFYSKGGQNTGGEIIHAEDIRNTEVEVYGLSNRDVALSVTVSHSLKPLPGRLLHFQLLFVIALRP